MRVLISAHAELSHLQPLVPLSWALRAAGHRVLVVVPDGLAPSVRALGLDTAPVSFDSDTTRAVHEALRAVGPDTIPVEAWEQPDARFWARIATRFADNARHTFADHLAIARGWRPDLIICDPMEGAAPMVAGVLGVPVVQHRWGVDETAGAFQDRLAELLEPDCHDLGLPGLPAPALVVDPCPPRLQRPDAPAGRPVRYIPSNGPGALPGWTREPARHRRVCVSMGTKVHDLGLTRVLRWVLEAVADLGDTEIVLAVPDLSPEDYATVADRVVAVGPVPLVLVLEHCAVLVHHGGHGTGLTAASLGVPQLVLPQFADQFGFARQAVAAGIARALDTLDTQRDRSLLGASLDALLNGTAHRAAAARLADEVAATPPPADVVAELEAIVLSGPGGQVPLEHLAGDPAR
jgi:UDP:flavonoid glycosyltransferase YjiC (YdhE family)